MKPKCLADMNDFFLVFSFLFAFLAFLSLPASIASVSSLISLVSSPSSVFNYSLCSAFFKLLSFHSPLAVFVFHFGHFISLSVLIWTI